MLLKVLIVGLCIFYLYRMISAPKISGPHNKEKIQKKEYDDYVDYEEVE